MIFDEVLLYFLFPIVLLFLQYSLPVFVQHTGVRVGGEGSHVRVIETVYSNIRYPKMSDAHQRGLVAKAVVWVVPGK